MCSRAERPAADTLGTISSSTVQSRMVAPPSIPGSCMGGWPGGPSQACLRACVLLCVCVVVCVSALYYIMRCNGGFSVMPLVLLRPASPEGSSGMHAVIAQIYNIYIYVHACMLYMYIYAYMPIIFILEQNTLVQLLSSFCS